MLTLGMRWLKNTFFENLQLDGKLYDLCENKFILPIGKLSFHLT